MSRHPFLSGNRERDIRAPFELEEQEREAEKVEGADLADTPEEPVQKKEEKKGEANLLGTAGALIANADLDMTWEKTIPWLRSLTKLPIVIKGIQCVEVRWWSGDFEGFVVIMQFQDAVLAAEAGCDGILISNHGGRQLE